MSEPSDRSRDARERFRALVERSEDSLDVAEAALWIAAEARPELDVPHYLARLDEFAELARPVVEGASDDPGRVAGLNDVVFGGLGFRGNQEDYYDVRNSFLDQVIERRCGIPITLCVVYTEIARRLDLRAVGIGFPGHFLASVAGSGDDDGIVVDAFAGSVVTREVCGERLRAAVGSDAQLAQALRASRPKEILLRMLSNLKHLHVERDDFEAALACCDRALLLDSENPLELRDRGLVHQRLECFGPAVADLERFLELAPRHESADTVRHALGPLRSRARRIH